MASFITNHVISDNSQRINCFILTGGTVKVFKSLGIDSYFKANILPEDLRNCVVYTDKDPSTSVSDGLALVGRNYALFKGCTNAHYNASLSPSEREKAKGLKNQLDILVAEKLKEITADSLKGAISKDICDEVMTKATSAIARFASYHDVNPSLDDLKQYLKDAISSACSNSGKIISKHITDCRKRNLFKTSEEIIKLVNKYTVQDVNMPSTAQYSSMSNISINIDIDELINKVSTKVRGHVVIAVLYKMLFPIATLFWGIIRVVDYFSNEEPLTFKEFFNDFIEGVEGPLSWVTSRGRLRLEREKVESQFKENESDFSIETYCKIYEQLTDIEKIVDCGIKGVITTYQEDAYKVIERVFK